MAMDVDAIAHVQLGAGLWGRPLPAGILHFLVRLPKLATICLAVITDVNSIFMALAEGEDVQQKMREDVEEMEGHTREVEGVLKTVLPPECMIIFALDDV